MSTLFQALQNRPLAEDQTRLLAVPIAPHHFEKAQRVARGMDLADLIGVNGRDGD